MEMYQTNFTELTQDLPRKLTIDSSPIEDPYSEAQIAEELVEEHQTQLQDGEEEEEDFSFCCGRPDGSPVSAEDVFAEGRIRPVFPLFNQSLLLSGESGVIYPLQQPIKRLFAEDAGECPRVVEEIDLPSPGTCKKSNSTGSSKLCRFVDTVVPRSSSDGKDAFVFLRKDKGDDAVLMAKVVGKDKVNSKVRKPLPSAGKGKATEKHRSYLPYRRDLLGFFTNSNLLSKNVHPF